MLIKEREIKGVFEIELEPQKDRRGFFMRTYDEMIFDKYKLQQKWVQENHSYAKIRGTIRGLHFQFPPFSEIKLVRVARGEVFAVFVDIRKGFSTFGQWGTVNLSEDNKKMLYIPKGFALGTCTLSDCCSMLYKMSDYYTPESQGVIKWNDPDLSIDWPVDNDPIISEKDENAKSFKEFIATHGSIIV